MRITSLMHRVRSAAFIAKDSSKGFRTRPCARMSDRRTIDLQKTSRIGDGHGMTATRRAVIVRPSDRIAFACRPMLEGPMIDCDSEPPT